MVCFTSHLYINWKNIHRNSQPGSCMFYVAYNTDNCLVEINVHLDGENVVTLSLSFKMLLLKYFSTHDGESGSLWMQWFPFSLNH